MSIHAIVNRPVRWAIVGLGRISPRHLEALAGLGDRARLVAVCDEDAAALAAFGQAGVEKYSRLEELLEKAQVDVVSICTPSGLHPAHGMMAAKAGKHVLVEKPMATNWAQGLALVEACKASGTGLFMVLQNRYNPPVVALKKAMDEGRFGKIYMISGTVFWTRPQSYYDQAAWRGTKAMDGGAFMNQASHYVDMMGWLGGAVSSVQASVATLARNIEAEDTGAAIFGYESGAIGTLNVSVLTYPRNREGSITVLGEKGHVRIGGTAMNVVEAWEFADKRAEDHGIASASYATDSVYGNGHSALYERVVAALAGGFAPDIGGEEGLRMLELLCAVYEAAQTGQAVRLPYARG